MNFKKKVSAAVYSFKNDPQDVGLGMVRTLVLSAVVGTVAGLGAVALVSMLQLSEWLFLGKIGGYVPVPAGGEPHMFDLPAISSGVNRLAILFLPAFGGLLTGWFVLKFAPEAEGHGTDSAIEAYHFRGGKVRPVVPPVKAIATSILIGTGGSAGCEGPITQIGSGFGSVLAGWLGLSVAQRRIFMAAGMAAGVGALFHAPMAGALFAAEVLYRDLDLEYEVLVPSIIASVSGYAVFSKIFGFTPLFVTPYSMFYRPKMLILYLIMAFIIAYGARFYTYFFYKVHEFFSKSRIPHFLRPAAGGMLTGIIGFFFLPALASGYGTIQQALSYDADTSSNITLSVLLGVFFLKTLATAFSVGSGGSGGIFGPAIVVGGALGGACGIIFSELLPSWNVPIGAFTLVGMVAFFGCAAKTPISTVLMVGEMTGNYHLLVPSMWVCIIAYMLSRKVSLYRSQLPNRFEAPVHRGSMISGVLRNLTVKDLLNVKAHSRTFLSLNENTVLAEAISRIAHGTQSVFPVIDANGAVTGIVTRTDLAPLISSDPSLHKMMLVGDLALKRHRSVVTKDSLQTVLGALDAEDADQILAVSDDVPPGPIGIISHNDVVEAYQNEISAIR